MTRYCKTLVMAMALLWGTSKARSQPAVFFDDFEGNALLPHWSQPPPSYWEYNVGNSMLDVTGLFNLSSPKSPSNFAGISAAFAPQTDFRMDVWMGWEAGQQPHRLAVHVGGPFGGNLNVATFGYVNDASFGPNPLIFAGASNQGVTMPAPPPGIYQFTISRMANQFNFHFNGIPFASFQDSFGTPAAAVQLDFLGPYPGTLSAFHIDRVQVVPTPGVLALLFPLSLVCTARRRR